MNASYQATTAGWRELVELPDIGVPCIEAKIDTATDISILHTSFIEHYRRENDLWVRFCINPLTDKECTRVVCQAPVKRTEILQSTENHDESFFVIEATIKIGKLHTQQDIVLKYESGKQHAMRLGRNALQALNIKVDPNRSFVLSNHQNEYLKQEPLYA